MISYIKTFAPIWKARAKSFLSKENGEVNIVVIVVLIAIAVGLAIIFRNQIMSLLDSLFGKINERADEL